MGTPSYPPPPPSKGRDRSSLVSVMMPTIKRERSFFERRWAQLTTFIEDLGVVAQLTVRVARVLFARPLEWRAVIYQMEVVGVASAAIASVTAIFIGMV